MEPVKKIQKLDPTNPIVFTKAYRKKKLDEIKLIKVKWACGENEKHLFDLQIHSSEGFSTFLVNLKELIQKSDFGAMDSKDVNPYVLFSGVHGSDYRIAKLLEHWRQGKYIDPPEIAPSGYHRLYFGNGRHRTIAAFHIGETKIPVIIHHTLVQNVSSIIHLDKF